MKQLIFSIVHKLSNISEELFAQFPEWIETGPEGNYTDVIVGGDGQVLELWVPDDADEVAIQAVVSAHDPNQLTAAEQYLAGQVAKQQIANDAKADFLGSDFAGITFADAEQLVDQAADLTAIKVILKKVIRAVLALTKNTIELE